MITRLIKPIDSNSFFIFGARGTGKTTYLREQWKKECFYINLLQDETESKYSKEPDRLLYDLQAMQNKPEWVVIDEIQKIPKLLDVVHHIIESQKIKFVLTGSSARKLKKMKANLLAGRAFQYHMYPLTVHELGNQFDLETVLHYGSLPASINMNIESKQEFLRSYTQTYLKEEILQEQIVRNGTAFRNFLEIAAQMNGKSINFSKCARDINVETVTVQNFYQILEDTLVGFFVPAYSKSARKSVKLQPKFYIFDLGVKRAMEKILQNKIPLHGGEYGLAFEHFIACELYRINSYFRKDFTISHYQTTAGGEIDLVLHRGNDVLAVEIKSSNKIYGAEVKKVSSIASALKPNNIFYISQERSESQIEDVRCMYWKDFLDYFKSY